MDERDTSIIAQNAGNSAAVILAAALNAGHVEKGAILDTFDKIRSHIFAGTLDAVRAQQPPQQRSNTDQPQQAMAGQQVVPACNHGPRVFRSGKSKKTGEPYSAWFCNQPMDATDKCSPVFL